VHGHGSTNIRLLGAVLLGASAATSGATAQVRALPVFFDPTYSFTSRIGVDIGHGGESDGFTAVASAGRLFYVGNCARLAATVMAGMWNPPGGGFDAELNAGAKVSYLLNPCPSAFSTPNPTFRLFAGGGLTRVGGRSVFNVPLGIGLGYMLTVPIGRIEPWVTPRLHYRESLMTPGESSWDVAVSGGINIGAGAIAGLRLSADCCEGGVGGGYGFSLWF
jgi:hypothetical protein